MRCTFHLSHDWPARQDFPGVLGGKSSEQPRKREALSVPSWEVEGEQHGQASVEGTLGRVQAPQAALLLGEGRG